MNIIGLGTRRLSVKLRITTDEDLWAISDYLFSIPHRRLIPTGVARRLNRMDRRLKAAGEVGAE